MIKYLSAKIRLSAHIQITQTARSAEVKDKRPGTWENGSRSRPFFNWKSQIIDFHHLLIKQGDALYSVENEAIPEKRQRSPLSPNFYH